MPELIQDLVTLPILHCEIEESKRVPAATSYAGLRLVHETLQHLGLIDDMKKFGLKQAGYSDEVPLTAIILLLASGGKSVSDWDYLKGEKGFERFYGLKPCVDVLERYLPRLKFTELVAHAEEKEENQGRAGYTETLDPLQIKVIRKKWKKAGCPTQLTLDIDASITETEKKAALYCYEKMKAYQPMNVYCPELQMIIAHEFRDGNISPQLGYMRLVKRCRKILPEVNVWVVRSDSAGYQNVFLDWMTTEGILYYITSDRPQEMDKEIGRIPEDRWQDLILEGKKTSDQFAELDHCAAFSSQAECRLRIRHRRYWILRRPAKKQPYVYHVIVTNDLSQGHEEVIQKHRGRCGSVEYMHSQLNQLGMDRMPSGTFEVNAAWYSLGCLTHNILRFMQVHVLSESLKTCEIDTLRFRFLRAVAIVIKKARGLILRFEEGSLPYRYYLQGRIRLAALSP